jgi:hypothetical protein
MPTSVGMTNGVVRRVGIDGRWYKKWHSSEPVSFAMKPLRTWAMRFRTWAMRYFQLDR